MPIQTIDLFAGPGGLGEGFSSLDAGNAFKIILSAEMESSAHSTLQLRSYFRHVTQSGSAQKYYDYCNSSAAAHPSVSDPVTWEKATAEARQITLGTTKGNAELDCLLDERLNVSEDCVLIGGPPCQAYSLAGRVRNAGKENYRAEEDHRHFLYREYLRTIQARRPAVFVMENVKGILSSQVAGRRIFNDILQDLVDPNKALNIDSDGVKYRIHSLVSETCYESGMDPEKTDPRDFIIKSENYGIPQARHRVILLGLREDMPKAFPKLIRGKAMRVFDAIGDLPRIRSHLSRRADVSQEWADAVRVNITSLATDAVELGYDKLAIELCNIRDKVDATLSTGELRYRKNSSCLPASHVLAKWYRDEKLEVFLNHEARGHMVSDLRRYVFCAAYANVNNGVSPKGHSQFVLSDLHPNHENWKTGKFADRFRVQSKDKPATTITSHIAKDGHYFIHFDAAQCRSLTVREAARLQTFPDNYFFEGNRTQQFHQVGNAVPPMLAQKIAIVVRSILNSEVGDSVKGESSGMLQLALLSTDSVKESETAA
jgi:DNA (cytosine-5)-methyltransferase 1